MTLLHSILHADPKRHPLLILQSSLAQSSLPILRSLLVENSRRIILFSLLYPPSDAVLPESVVVHNWLHRVPGYEDAERSPTELTERIHKIVLQESSQSTTVVIDSVETLLSDTGSVTETYKCLSSLLVLIRKQPGMKLSCPFIAHNHSSGARLILHSQSPSRLIPLITTTAFSSSLSYLIAHPPALLQHLSKDLFVPPPPLSPDAKFWTVFIPISERTSDTERLVFGPSGEGSGHPSEIVVELIIREAGRRKRGVERILEGWSNASSCELGALETLKDSMSKQKVVRKAN